MPAAALGGTSALASRRAALQGQSGWNGLIHNRRIFFVAVFASLGGLLYGYNQGVFSSVLAMNNFQRQMGKTATDSSTKGWLVAILELGAWFGVLLTGPTTDRISRKYTIVVAVIIFCIGVIVQTAAFHPSSIYGGRFITGIGVGSLSMAVPLYNAELAPAEVRGSLVALQQLAITFGIMISFWIDYGTNFIGGTGNGQSPAAWRIPLALQLVPAIILGIGILFMPFSPRWLVNVGREEEALTVLSHSRRLPRENELVQIEFLEIKAQYIFEQQLSRENFPQYQDGSLRSSIYLSALTYWRLLSNLSLLHRIFIGGATMFFQQWTGVNAILYYAPFIFQDLGLTSNANSLLATGVVGVAMFLATIPAVIWVDRIGRKPVLVSGAFLMAACHIIVAILSSQFSSNWAGHRAAGWVACALVWIFAMAFGYSWGPCAWVIISEIFPLSVRSKGMSIAASSNWMNNFIVGEVTPTMFNNISWRTFIIFGVFSFVGGLYIWFFVPETSGKTLEEMDEVFGSEAIAAADAERLSRIHKEIGLTAYLHGDTESATDEKSEKGSNKY